MSLFRSYAKWMCAGALILGAVTWFGVDGAPSSRSSAFAGSLGGGSLARGSLAAWSLGDPSGSTTAADLTDSADNLSNGTPGPDDDGTVNGGLTFGVPGPVINSSDTAAGFNGNNHGATQIAIGSGTNTTIATFSSPVRPSDGLVVVVSNYSDNQMYNESNVPADSAGDTFTEVAHYDNNNSSGDAVSIWANYGAKGGSTTINASAWASGDGSDSLAITAYEVPGLVQVDQVSITSGNGTSISTQTLTTSTANEFAVVGATATNPLSAGSGWGHFEGQPFGGNYYGGSETQSVSNAGTSVTGTMTATYSAWWAAALVTFELASPASVTLPTNSVLEPPGSVAVEAWFNTLSPLPQTIFGSCGDGYRLAMSGREPYFQVYGTPGNVNVVRDPTPLQQNTWYQVAASDDGTKMAIYINGVMVASSAATSTIDYSSVTSLSLGTGCNQYFYGSIADVSLYGEPLTAADVMSDYVDSGRQINPGTITTLAGTGSSGTPSADGLPGTSTTLNTPYGIAADTQGDVFFTDLLACDVREITRTGQVVTIAGLSGNCGYADGSGNQALFNHPWGIAVDKQGDIYVADSANNRVREIVEGANGYSVTTLAGNGQSTETGDGGLATNAALNLPAGVAVDNAGNVFIADAAGNVVRQVNSSGIITRIAGGGTGCSAQSDAVGDGCSATQAQLQWPMSVAVDGQGNLFIADEGNNRVREVSSATIVTIWGNGVAGYNLSGGQTQQEIQPFGIAADWAGDLVVSDANCACVASLMRNHFASTMTLAGQPGTAGYAGDGGSATSAELNTPEGVAMAWSGAVYIADSQNGSIRAISPQPSSFVMGIADQASTTPYQADLQDSSGHQPVMVTRTGVGTYQLTLTNVSIGTDPTYGAIAISPLGSLASCEATNVNPGSSQVTVQCTGTNGSPLDAFFEFAIPTIRFGSGTGVPAVNVPGAYAYLTATQDTQAAYTYSDYTQGFYSAALSQGQAVVTSPSTGSYNVTIPGIIGSLNSAQDVGSVIVSAVGGGGNVCNPVGNWGPLSSGSTTLLVSVQCFNLSTGNPVASQFNIIYNYNLSIIGQPVGAFGYASTDGQSSWSGTMSPSGSFESTIGSVSMVDNYAGNYTVTFSNLLRDGSTARNILVSADQSSSTPVTCIDTNPTGDLTGDLVVTVNCYGQGGLVNSPFDISVIN